MRTCGRPFATSSAAGGLEVDAGRDGAEGLALLEGRRAYGLLITDQRLAGDMTGLELIRAMRLRLANPPPAIIISGEVDSPLLRDAAEEGLTVLHKPVQPEKLRQLLGQDLRQRVEVDAA